MRYGKNRVGKNVQIYDPVTRGFPSHEYLGSKDFPGVIIGDDAVIRSGSIIYCEAIIGHRFQCGHNVFTEYTEKSHCPVADTRAEEVLSLPVHPLVTGEERVYRAACINEVT